MEETRRDSAVAYPLGLKKEINDVPLFRLWRDHEFAGFKIPFPRQHSVEFGVLIPHFCGKLAQFAEFSETSFGQDEAILLANLLEHSSGDVRLAVRAVTSARGGQLRERTHADMRPKGEEFFVPDGSLAVVAEFNACENSMHL